MSFMFKKMTAGFLLFGIVFSGILMLAADRAQAQSTECRAATARFESASAQHEAAERALDQAAQNEAAAFSNYAQARSKARQANQEAVSAFENWQAARRALTTASSPVAKSADSDSVIGGMSALLFGTDEDEIEAAQKALDEAAANNRSARERAQEAELELDAAKNALDSAEAAKDEASRQAGEAHDAKLEAEDAKNEACRNDMWANLLGDIMEDKPEDNEDFDQTNDDIRNNNNEANQEDISIAENERRNGTGNASNCDIGSGTNCTSVEFSINDGSFTGGKTTYSMGGKTLASNLANASTTFKGTAAKGSTQTLTVSCSGTASCFFDFTVLSGASCPTLNNVPISLGNSVTHTCTIN